MRAEAARAAARAAGTRTAHELLARHLADLTEADRAARMARRDADTRLADASRILTKAEAERGVMQGKLETLQSAAARHADEAQAAATELLRAEAARAELEDLHAAKARLEDIRTTLEASRLTMLARRTAHDEIRRDGERRSARIARIGEESAGWRKRLDSAAGRLSELKARQTDTDTALVAARHKPGALTDMRAGLADKITTAERRKAAASEALSVGEAGLRAAIGAERDAARAAS